MEVIQIKAPSTDGNVTCLFIKRGGFRQASQPTGKHIAVQICALEPPFALADVEGPPGVQNPPVVEDGTVTLHHAELKQAFRGADEVVESLGRSEERMKGYPASAKG
jgi:hypothetical protein